MNAAKDCTLQEKLPPMRHGAHPGGGGAARLRGGLARLRRAEHGRRVHRRQRSPTAASPHVDERRREHRLLRRALVPRRPRRAPTRRPRAERRRDSGDLVLVRLSGFDASMFPGSWYDGGGWDDAKYAAASHVLIAPTPTLGVESAATHGTSAEFASWAKSELIGGTFAKMKAGAARYPPGSRHSASGPAAALRRS